MNEKKNLPPNRNMMIVFLNKFNVATYQELDTWSDQRVKEAYEFLRQELKKGTTK